MEGIGGGRLDTESKLETEQQKTEMEDKIVRWGIVAGVHLQSGG